MIDAKELTARDFLDYLAWKAAKLIGWDTKTARWRVGFRRQGEYANLIVYSMSPSQRKRNFESIEAGCIEILCPITSNEKAWLSCLLIASRVNPIRVGTVEILPANPCLEEILLEMDVEGWIPWKDREKQQ